MTHDPLCRFYGKRAADAEYGDCEYCHLIAQVRADERFSAVEGAVVIASQSGASPELVQLLSSMYERSEAPGADEMRREAARELTRLAQEMGIVP